MLKLLELGDSNVLLRVLHKSHRFPIRRQIEFKIACQCTSCWLDKRQSICLPIFSFLSCPQLQSAYDRVCIVTCTHNSFDDGSFSAAGPPV